LVCGIFVFLSKSLPIILFILFFSLLRKERYRYRYMGGIGEEIGKKEKEENRYRVIG